MPELCLYLRVIALESPGCNGDWGHLTLTARASTTLGINY